MKQTQEKIMSLCEIQRRLKVPKKQKAAGFGGYYYRSCEDILEALKPLLHEYSFTMTVSDSILPVSDRVYIVATGLLFDENGKEIAKASAAAREQKEKNKMDAAQITGSTSSYARKCMLNGMFLLDDTKDPDAQFISADEDKKYEAIVEGFKCVKNGEDLMAIWGALTGRDKRLYKDDKDEAKKRLGL